MPRRRLLNSDVNKTKQAAYHYAIRLLAHREFCTVEMRQRLAGREFDAEVISWAIDQLKQDGYLSELRYAEAYLRSRINKGEAPWLAAKRAGQKGAESAAIESALAQLTEDYDAEEAARDLISGRDPGGLRFDDERVWQRQARFLRNKGFATDVILRVLKQ
ncbi:MAG: regulatory protein RecX [Mariprofundus sp.]|nr:regulatory protein RecX [Mariprofundus sp.]